ncbi:hypothetical protein VP01_1276g3 [Puccinia sorghi]|uniref:Uncharacterized protein n=1 Tax=Puccinia sorghi TaxID=27349 RepID=A0A0L6VNV6_9BASI|nr:hypothetical protein VP01_1276g3 [Puccinia sorghi]
MNPFMILFSLPSETKALQCPNFLSPFQICPWPLILPGGKQKDYMFYHLHRTFPLELRRRIHTQKHKRRSDPYTSKYALRKIHLIHLLSFFPAPSVLFVLLVSNFISPLPPPYLSKTCKQCRSQASLLSKYHTRPAANQCGYLKPCDLDCVCEQECLRVTWKLNDHQQQQYLCSEPRIVCTNVKQLSIVEQSCGSGLPGKSLHLGGCKVKRKSRYGSEYSFGRFLDSAEKKEKIRRGVHGALKSLKPDKQGEFNRNKPHTNIPAKIPGNGHRICWNSFFGGLETKWKASEDTGNTFIPAAIIPWVNSLVATPIAKARQKICMDVFMDFGWSWMLFWDDSEMVKKMGFFQSPGVVNEKGRTLEVLIKLLTSSIPGCDRGKQAHFKAFLGFLSQFKRIPQLIEVHTSTQTTSLATTRTRGNSFSPALHPGNLAHFVGLVTTGEVKKPGLALEIPYQPGLYKTTRPKPGYPASYNFNIEISPAQFHLLPTSNNLNRTNFCLSESTLQNPSATSWRFWRSPFTNNFERDLNNPCLQVPLRINNKVFFILLFFVHSFLKLNIIWIFPIKPFSYVQNFPQEQADSEALIAESHHVMAWCDESDQSKIIGPKYSKKTFLQEVRVGADIFFFSYFWENWLLPFFFFFLEGVGYFQAPNASGSSFPQSLTGSQENQRRINKQRNLSPLIIPESRPQPLDYLQLSFDFQIKLNPLSHSSGNGFNFAHHHTGTNYPSVTFPEHILSLMIFPFPYSDITQIFDSACSWHAACSSQAAIQTPHVCICRCFGRLCIKAWLNHFWRMVGVKTEASWDFLHVNCRQLRKFFLQCHSSLLLVFFNQPYGYPFNCYTSIVENPRISSSTHSSATQYPPELLGSFECPTLRTILQFSPPSPVVPILASSNRCCRSTQRSLTYNTDVHQFYFLFVETTHRQTDTVDWLQERRPRAALQESQVAVLICILKKDRQDGKGEGGDKRHEQVERDRQRCSTGEKWIVQKNDY